jgi:succinylglutamic semialdehyde dehydrogenase
MTNSLFINNNWRIGGGPTFSRTDPAENRLTWEGPAASPADIDAAVNAARSASAAWAKLPLDKRAEYLDKFAAALKAHAGEILEAISLETGKPKWEAKTEVDALIAKVDLTKKSLAARQPVTATTTAGVTAATRWRPHGVLAVLGPFNLPAHLPNGHILPALLAGNTVVFKPSELTPQVGELYTKCWHEAALPPGVFDMIQGGRDQGARLAGHPNIDGVLFTGSRNAGVALSKMLAPHPEKILALEMGGNNPLVATQIKNLDAAAYHIIQSAFITAGQRCTCARRLILINDAEGDQLLERLAAMTLKIKIAAPSMSPEPFAGPVISDAAGQRMLDAEKSLLTRGGLAITPLQPLLKPALLRPGIIDVTKVVSREDEELFGPLLQVIRVKNFDAAIAEANNTKFGLAAGLLSDDASLWQRFQNEIRAGIVNWNRPTTGASSALPFGGLGESGNHRPAGFFSIDYCADPVASLESQMLTLPESLSPGISL